MKRIPKYITIFILFCLYLVNIMIFALIWTIGGSFRKPLELLDNSFGEIINSEEEIINSEEE